MSMSKTTEMTDILTDAVVKAINKHGVDEDAIASALDKGAVKFINTNKQLLIDQVLKVAKDNIAMPQVIEVKQPDQTSKPQISHKQFDELVKCVSSTIPVLMVGMPGTGKTTAAEQMATVFDTDFYSISVGMQTTKTDILGFVDAGGQYQSTGFREAFEKGGVFLMDEVDAGNPNVLIVINSAISNGFCQFPDKMIHAHKDFKFIATANTFGTGADTKFIGRNQLDAATLDRFITLNWEIDEFVEESLCTNKEWLSKVKNLRKDVDKTGRDILVSPRVSLYGDRLLTAGFNMRKTAEMTILKGKDPDTKNYIINTMGV